MIQKYVFLCLCCFLPLRLSAFVLHSASDNLQSERDAVLRFLEDLGEGNGAGSGPGPAMGAQNLGFGAAAWEGSTRSFRGEDRKKRAFDLSQADQDPARVNATLKAMTALSGAAVQAIGGPSQGAYAQSLQSNGSVLASSSNATLSAQGGLMQEEASAVSLGDASSAQSFVEAMQGLPAASGGGAPTAEDQAWIASLQQTGSSVAGSAASAMESAATQALESWAQQEAGASGNGSSSSSFLDSLVGGLGSSASSGNASEYAAAAGLAGGGQGLGGPGGSGDGSARTVLSTPSGAGSLPVSAGGGAASGGILPSSNP